MPYQNSPGVLDREFSIPGSIPGVDTTQAAIAGNFRWGPTEEIMRVADEPELLKQVGKPDQNTFIDFFVAANFLSYARNLKLVRANANSNTAVANVSGGTVIIKNETHYEETYYDGSGTFGSWAAKYPGALGNSLRVSSCPSSNAYSATNSLTANVESGNTIITLSGAASSDQTRVLAVGDFINIGAATGDLEVVAVSDEYVTLNTAPTVNLTANAIVSKWKYHEEFDGAPGTSSWASQLGGSGDEMHIIVIDEGGKFSGVPNTVLDKFAFVSKASDAQASTGISNYYVDVIKNQSPYIWWGDHQTGGTNWGSEAAATTFTAVNTPEYVRLSGGTDEAVTDGQLMLAYDRFKREDDLDISFIMSSGHSATVANHIIQNVAEFREDCLAVISPARADAVNNDGDEPTDIIDFRNALPSTSWGFLTDNWKYQFDKYNNKWRWIPDNGDTAGIMARSDFLTDPWISPAGLNRGQMKNVTKLAWVSNKSERDDMYRKGINSYVTFPGEGTVLWGDKTLLSKPDAFDRVNVRRLFIVLRKAISRAARYSLFEQNDRFTRSQFVALIEPFLRNVQGRRGIEDFRVICDETNNTPDVRDRNEFVASIFIKPTRSINFITLNFVALGSSVSFTEVIGQQF